MLLPGQKHGLLGKVLCWDSKSIFRLAPPWVFQVGATVVCSSPFLEIGCVRVREGARGWASDLSNPEQNDNFSRPSW